MKKLRLLFIIIVCISSYKKSICQWQTNPIGTPYSFSISQNSFANFTKQFIWVGSFGSRISIDTGKTFTLVNNDSNSTFKGALNDSTLILNKYSNIFKKSVIQKTTDWGKTWNPYFIINGNDTAFKKISYNFKLINSFDEKHAWLLGDTLNGCHEIWRTEDGGNNWLRVPCANVNLLINLKVNSGKKIYNVGSTTFMVNPKPDASLIVARDYGKTWDSIHIDKISKNNIDPSIVSIAFSDSMHGLLSYYKNIIKDTATFLLRTEDGGYTWNDMTEKGLTNMCYAKATNKQLGFYIASTSDGANKHYYSKVSFDNGYTWKVLDTLQHTSFSFKDAEFGMGIQYTKLISYLDLFTGFPPGFASSNDLIKPLKTEVKIYPNPATEILNIESSQDGKYECINISGQILMSGIAKANQLNTLPISGLASGLYFLKFTSDNSTEIKKLIVE